MRVLVTRPAEDAARTAAALRALGHEPVVAPVTVIERQDVHVPPGPYDAVVISSVNAALPAPAGLAHLPVFVVGARAAKSMQQQGWLNVHPPGADATALLAHVTEMVPPRARVLYLAGEPRKPAIGTGLERLNINCDVIIVYRATLLPLPVAALQPPPRVALHYSRASAERFIAAAGPAGVAAIGWHCCLSEDVAAAFDECAPAKILTAANPTEASLFALLSLCH